jgi:hypothetical protein
MYDATKENVLSRVLWLYGLHTILSNIFLVVGYFFLPEGFLRDTPLSWAGNVAASPETARGEFLATLFFNLGMMSMIALGLNLITIKGFPQGYFVPITLGLVSGLFLGTNSFVAMDLATIPFREGQAVGFTIGGIEMLGYICLVASTVKFGIYQYDSWWQWNEKPHKVMNLKDIQLSKFEILCFVSGVILIVIAAYRESYGV